MEVYKSHNIFKWQGIYKENDILLAAAVSMERTHTNGSNQPHPSFENNRPELGPQTPTHRDFGPLRWEGDSHNTNIKKGVIMANIEIILMTQGININTPGKHL